MTALCAEGYTGDYCSQCAVDYTKDFLRCVECDATGVLVTLFLVYGIYLAVLATLVVVLSTHYLITVMALLISIQSFALVGRASTNFLPGQAGEYAGTFFRYLSLVLFEIEFLDLGCSVDDFTFIPTFWGTLVFIGAVWVMFMIAVCIRVAVKWRSCAAFKTHFPRRALHSTIILAAICYLQVRCCVGCGGFGGFAGGGLRGDVASLCRAATTCFK